MSPESNSAMLYDQLRVLVLEEIEGEVDRRLCSAILRLFIWFGRSLVDLPIVHPKVAHASPYI